MAACVYCQERASFFSRVCRECRRLIAAVKELGDSYGYRTLLETLEATGVSPAKIEKFLDTDLDQTGSFNQKVTARMTNELMEALGQPSQMSAADVRTIEERIQRGESYLDLPDVTDSSQLKPSKD